MPLSEILPVLTLCNGCRRALTDADGNEVNLPPESARRVAWERGWAVEPEGYEPDDGDRHYCPECRKDREGREAA